MSRFLLRIGFFAGLGSACVVAATPSTPTPAASAAVPAVSQAAESADPAVRLPAVAGRMVDRGEFDGAEKSFREVLDSGKFSLEEQKDALMGMARLYRKKGSFAKTAAIYEKFLKDFPNDARCPLVMLELGRTLRAIGTYSMAISRFYGVINSTLKLTSDALNDYQLLAKTAQFEIAETHFEMGNYGEAARFFSKLRLLELVPEDRARAHFKAGYSHRLNKDHEAAIRTLQDFIDSYPKDENVAEAYFLLAATYWDSNRREEALAATLQLFQHQSDRPGNDAKRWTYWQRRTGNQLANDLYQVGETQSALQIYLRLADLSPEPEWRMPSLYQAGLCYERLKGVKEATDIYQSIVEAAAKAPTSVILGELAKMATWRQDQFSWQEETAQKAAALFSTLPPPKAPRGPEPKKDDDPGRSPKPAPSGL
jgi:TolA-binding protein